MKRLILGVAIAVVTSPVAAQTGDPARLDQRVGKLEKEMRAVQRNVFPQGVPVQPDLTAVPAPVEAPGAPASTPISDLTARVDALERQLTALTGANEQTGFKVRQLEDALTKLQARLTAMEGASAPTTGDAPAAQPEPAAVGGPTSATTVKPAVATRADPARRAAIAAIEMPSTGDAVEDAYTYGFRLYTAKLYPEAQMKLKEFTAKQPVAQRRWSYAQNLLGRAYLDEGKPALASVAFYDNYQKAPRGERAAESLTWLGQALIALKKPADACKVYAELADVYGSRLTSDQRGAPPRDVPTPTAPPEAAVARFRGDLARLIPHEATDKFGLAVSGGPDSVAMLLLAATAFPGRVEVATVDHGLRPASVQEAAFVVDLAERIGVPCAVLTLSTPVSGNLQSWAREERYAALTAWRRKRRLRWLLTAHHAEDQRETVLMRLNRGSGVSGLAGIRAVNGKVLRPLLTWRRDELRAVVDQCGVVPVADPSNDDDRFDRARLRKALADTGWLDPVAVAHSAAMAGVADEALDWMTWRLGELIEIDEDAVAFDRRRLDLPRELVRRLVLRALLHFDAEPRWRGSEMARFVARLERGEAATLGSVAARAEDGFWFFERAPERSVATPPATA